VNCKRSWKKGASVVIPTFNRASYLYATLLLLCGQRTEDSFPYEIIIVDSGSDNTGTVVNYFSALHPGLIIYKKMTHCRNRSLLRNTGAAAARYDVLIFMDNDILVPPDFIKTHYDIQNRTNHLVLLGRRRSLTAFSIRNTGKEMLCTDFTMLEKLPWYEDERLYEMSEEEQWRFVYSHGMSLHSEDFFAAGQFNVKFGEHWEFEDLELGFNLMNTGCSFFFLPEPCTYHQPHFDQSNTEQQLTHPNRQLFLRLHNCFAAELCIGFYSRFNEFYTQLKTIPFTVPEKAVLRKYALVLGCIFTSGSPCRSDTQFLGIYIPKNDGSCRNALILKTFYEMPHDIQTAVTAEAFRVSQRITLESYSEKHLQVFAGACAAAGLSVSAGCTHGMITAVLQSPMTPSVYSMTLPDVLSPEKRYVYLWLAAALTEHGCAVTLHDPKNVSQISGTDFTLPDSAASKLSPFMCRSYGFVRTLSVYPAAAMLPDKILSAPDSPDTFIMHDEEYMSTYKKNERDVYAHSRHSEQGCYQFLSFASIYAACRCGDKPVCGQSAPNTFCSFMENGFLEDGIDILLKAFGAYSAEHSDARLSIKLPDHEQLFAYCYPLHNEASKLAKTFGIRQKINSDANSLCRAVMEYNLTEKVSIIRKNMTITEVISFINAHESLVHTSRGCCTPPQVYAAVLLQKKTIVARHHRMLHLISEYCVTVPSSIHPFSDELAVPLVCANAAYTAGRTDKNGLIQAFSAQHSKKLSAEEAFDTVRLFNPVFFFTQTL